MHWVVIGLLVANVAFFIWEFNRKLMERRTEPLTAQPIPSTVEPLKLVSELREPPPLREVTAEPEPMTVPAPDPAGAPIPPPETPPAPPGTPELRTKVCLLAGPFPSEGDAAWVQKWFENRQMQAQRRAETQTEIKRFWVYLEPQPSQEVAQQKVEDLKSKGIQDFRLIKGGEMRNAISLGVYSTQNSVNRRLAELAGQGYQPLVVPRETETRTVHWVDISGEHNRESLLAEAKRQWPNKVSESPICGEIAAEKTSP